MQLAIVSREFHCSEAVAVPYKLGILRGGRGGGDRIGDWGMAIHGPPDRREHPGHPFGGVGVLFEIVHRITIVQSPDAVHELAIVLQRGQLPTCGSKKKGYRYSMGDQRYGVCKLIRCLYV